MERAKRGGESIEATWNYAPYDFGKYYKLNTKSRNITNSTIKTKVFSEEGKYKNNYETTYISGELSGSLHANLFPLSPQEQGMLNLAVAFYYFNTNDLKNAYLALDLAKQSKDKREIEHCEESLKKLKNMLRNGLYAHVCPIPIEEVFARLESEKKPGGPSPKINLTCEWAEDSTRQKIKAWIEANGKSFAEVANELGITQRLLQIVCEGGITHPNIAKRMGLYFELNEIETEELMPEHQRPHSENYDPYKYRPVVFSWRSEFEMKKEVDFARYCAICKYKDRPESQEPCNECLEYGCNEDSKKPIMFKERNKK